MSTKVHLFCFLLFIAIITPARADIWQVYAGNFFFAPDSIVVAFGDTIVWTNLDGTHNVVEQSNPPLFDSGNPAPAPWNFQFVANLPLGVYTYNCELHPQQMTGFVTVIPYATPPDIEFVDLSVPEGATIGRSTFVTVAPSDADQDLTGFSASIDDTMHWTEWSSFPEFLFADTSLGLFPENSTVVSNEALVPGPHDLHFRAIDSRSVLSPVITRHVTVQTGFRPQMNPYVSSQYGESELYTDGSAYYSQDTELVLNISAAVAAYYSRINAYRYQDFTGIWSNWQAESRIVFDGLAEGDYPLQILARDLAGEFSDTLEYTVRIVNVVPSDTIVIVDETRNGNGNPGAPTDLQVDEFYESVLTENPYREKDYQDRYFLSPLDLRNAGLVIYHADDRSDINLFDNIEIFSDYLSRGGRIILSGWDICVPFADGSDSIAFEPGSFGYEFLRLEGARKLTARQATGFQGVNGNPSVTIDGSKLPASFNGTIDRSWVFTPREEATEIGILTVSNPGQNELEGRTVFYMYDGPFRIAVSGIPLYFCTEAEVHALFETIIPPMMAPTAAIPSHNTNAANYALLKIYPNPFNTTTHIEIQISRPEFVTLNLYDILGRQAATLLEAPLNAGIHTIRFDGTALASGIYFIQLNSRSSSETRKIVLLK